MLTRANGSKTALAIFRDEYFPPLAGSSSTQYHPSPRVARLSNSDVITVSNCEEANHYSITLATNKEAKRTMILDGGRKALHVLVFRE